MSTRVQSPTSAGNDLAPHGADVRALPPLVFAVPFLAGLALNRLRRWRLPGGRATRAAGSALTCGGLALSATGAGAFRRRGTTVVPHHPVSSMVTDGPYRFTRNPIYAGMAAAYVGGALARRTGWPLPFLPLALVAIRRLVIDPEERYLADLFGPQYDDYRARVPRWLPVPLR